MKITLRESQLTKVLDALFAENNCDLNSAQFYCSHAGNLVFGCDIHYDGDFDVDAALRVKPSPASDSLAIKIEVLQAENDLLLDVVKSLIDYDANVTDRVPGIISSYKSLMSKAHSAIAAVGVSS